MNKIFRCFMCVFTITISIMMFSLPTTASDPVETLGESVLYWQDKAVESTFELNKIKEDNNRLAKENEVLKSTVTEAETVMNELRSIINDMAIQNEKINSLRVQAEKDLNTALEQIKVLEELVRKLSGPRFNAIVGATYDIGGSFGLLAGVGMSL